MDCLKFLDNTDLFSLNTVHRQLQLAETHVCSISTTTLNQSLVRELFQLYSAKIYLTDSATENCIG